MTQIICRATACLFWEQGICGAEEIEYEPDTGCLMFQDMVDLEIEEEDEDYDWDSDADLFDNDDDEDEDDWENDDRWEDF